MNPDSTPSSQNQQKLRVARDATVRIERPGAEPILLTEEEAREVYSQLRRFYGRAKR